MPRTPGTTVPGQFPSGITESGYAFGASNRFSPGDSSKEFSGVSAWLYDAHTSSTTRLGYFDASHTGSDGFQQSGVDAANESGHAIGGSDASAARYG